MDIYCGYCDKKLENELSEWGKGWHKGYEDAQNPLFDCYKKIYTAKSPNTNQQVA